MSALNRRRFIQGTAAAAVAAGPFGGLLAHASRVSAGAPARANADGYGPLSPATDATTGQQLLSLPAGFRYRTFGAEGSTMSDGFITPSSHDGMECFSWKGGRVRLVRNHETTGPIEGGAQAGTRPYDPSCGGGTTTIEVDLRGNNDTWGEVNSWISAHGTFFNCSGASSAYDTWFTGEEDPAGPDLGPDLFGNTPEMFTKKHGYIFEVNPAWEPGEAPTPVPITHAGRFTHEAAIMDPGTGFLYLTQDNFLGPSGLFRYQAPNNPLRDKRVEDGGTLQMLAVTGSPRHVLYTHQEPGASFPVSWVNIEDPDPTYPANTAFIPSMNTLSDEGISKGAAQFSRLEGIRRRGRVLYFSSTQGGQGREGASSTFGPGFGQIWMLDLAQMQLTLVFEAPAPAAGDVGPGNRPPLSLPDNIAISPKGTLLICEDGTINVPPAPGRRGYQIPHNFIHGLTRDGVLFDFAENLVNDSEFTGAAFSPDGKSLFFNRQEPGITFEVRGPFHKGPW